MSLTLGPNATLLYHQVLSLTLGSNATLLYHQVLSLALGSNETFFYYHNYYHHHHRRLCRRPRPDIAVTAGSTSYDPVDDETSLPPQLSV